jgi:hypothetical protein
VIFPNVAPPDKHTNPLDRDFNKLDALCLRKLHYEFGLQWLTVLVDNFKKLDFAFCQKASM